MGSFAETASFWMSLGNPYRSLISASPAGHEVPNPTVQEIAIIASMHNMASTLRNPEMVKAVQSAEISERAHKLAADK
jgi:hypothetical protein